MDHKGSALPRQLFPFLEQSPELIYLDAAALKPIIKPALEVLNTAYTSGFGPINRSMYKGAEDATAAYEAARQSIAAWLGVSANELAFTLNTTYALYLAAYALIPTLVRKYPAKKTLLITSANHHSHWSLWYEIAQQYNLDVRVLQVLPGGHIPFQERTKIDDTILLAALTPVSNVYGLLDLHDVLQALHACQALVVYDAAQQVAHEYPLWRENGVSVAVCAGHKMYGPQGVGCLYIAQELHEYVTPVILGGGMAKSVVPTPVLRPYPYVLEAGTPHIAGVLSLAEACNYCTSAVRDTIHSHEYALSMYLHEQLRQREYCTVLSVPGSSIISFVLDAISSHDLAIALSHEDIAIRSGYHCAEPVHASADIPATARISLGAYTTRADLEKTLTTIDKIYAEFVSL